MSYNALGYSSTTIAVFIGLAILLAALAAICYSHLRMHLQRADDDAFAPSQFALMTAAIVTHVSSVGLAAYVNLWCWVIDSRINYNTGLIFIAPYVILGVVLLFPLGPMFARDGISHR